ncbi:MAG: hypothetical protein AAFO75_00570 [Pseudomonadota bacterium]
MRWSLRAGLGLLGFGAAGLALLAVNPSAESANDPENYGYIFAISHGPGLSLAHLEPTPSLNAPSLNNDGTVTDAAALKTKMEAFAATAQSLACEVVLTIGSIEIGSRCAYGSPATEAVTPPMTTGSISGL